MVQNHDSRGLSNMLMVIRVESPSKRSHNQGVATLLSLTLQPRVSKFMHSNC